MFESDSPQSTSIFPRSARRFNFRIGSYYLIFWRHRHICDVFLHLTNSSVCANLSKSLSESAAFSAAVVGGAGPSSRLRTTSTGFENMSGNADGASSMLDTSKAERSVWLMKCPQAVAQAWTEYGDAGQPLAKITVSVDPLKTNEQLVEVKVVDPTAPANMNKKGEARETSSTISQRKSTRSNKSEFMMELMANRSVTAPKSYSLNMSADIVPMCILSETSQGKVAIDGKVEHKFDMKPYNQNIEDYRRLCRERTKKSNFKTRQIQMIDNDHGGYNPMQGMMDFSSFNSKDRKGAAAPIKTQEMKRTRMDRNELENILFKLFERQSNWTLKQLVTETDQPQQFIKEILTDLGNYNKRGANQGTYELKPEYKKTAEDMEAE